MPFSSIYSNYYQIYTKVIMKLKETHNEGENEKDKGNWKNKE